MNFHDGGNNNGNYTPLAEINIIPFVDVMLVLLIITMVTAPFMEQGLSINLPLTQTSKELKQGVNEEPVVLYVSKDKGIMLAKQNVALDELSAKLLAVFQGKKNKEIFVKADKSVPYGEVAEIMSRVQAAGIEKVGLVTQAR